MNLHFQLLRGALILGTLVFVGTVEHPRVWAFAQDSTESTATSLAPKTDPRDGGGDEAEAGVPTVPAVGTGDEVAQSSEPAGDQAIEIAPQWKRLGKNQIWINHSAKKVMVGGKICLRDGPLEMFACPGNSKAHESIVAVAAKASEIHACLVALGFDPGHPVQWGDDYTPATGPLINVVVKWRQGALLKEADAKTMVRVSGSDKILETDWVFGGSQEFTDNITGEKIYYADSGEMICLSNFSTAMMDVPIKSSDAAEGLLFEANTPNIPPVNTKVYLVLTPRAKKQ